MGQKRHPLMRKRLFWRGLIILGLLVGLATITVANAGNLLMETPAASNIGGNIAINELRIDQSGTDDDEYFELFGDPNADLTGYYYLVIGDGAAGSGVIEEVTDLSGASTDANGYFVAAEATFSLGTANLTTDLNFENSDNVTHLLVTNFIGNDGDDLDTDDDGVLDSAPWTFVANCVGLVETVGSGDQLYCADSVGPDGSFVPAQAYKCAAGWFIGSFSLPGVDTPGEANSACPQPPSINEIRIDQGGTDNDEYFELMGDPNSSLDGLTYIVIGDGTGGSGTIEAVIPLTGTTIPADGHFLAVEDTYTLNNNADLTATLNFENSDNVTHMLVKDFSGAVDDDIDPDDDGTMNVTPWSEIVDCLALVETVGSGELIYCAETLGPDGTFVPAHAYDCPSGWEIGAFSLGADDTPGDPNVCPILGDLAVSKTGPPNVAAQAGGLLNYEVALMNSAEVTAANLILTDTLPANTSYISDNSGVAPTNPSPGVYVWALPDIPATATVTLQITLSMDVAIASGTTITNSVEAATDLAGDDPANNQAQWATTILSACGDPATLIHLIQGSGVSSPELGNIHTVEGIVVGDWQDVTTELKGFYLQEEDSDADADAGTSEAIFIFDNGYGVDAAVGDVVRVKGTVAEFGGLTELNALTEVQICASNASVTETIVPLPIPDLADWEQYEGMLIRVEGPLYVTEHFNLGRYGQVPLSINDRLWNPTQVVPPGMPANDLAEVNDRSRITLDDANVQQNRDPIIYPAGELTALQTLRGGDTLPYLVGVLDHYTNDSSEDYRIHPTQPISFTHANPRPPAPEAVGGRLKIGSLNVLNYFTTIDSGAPICGPAADQGCRGADSASEFNRQNDKIINALLTMNADVIGLIEIENHPSDDAVNNLISQLNTPFASGGAYNAINTGAIGTDAIKVAIIYKSASVTPVGSYAILDQSVDPTYLDSKNRPALAQTFMENSSGEIFTVVVNHLKSKGSACDDVGDPNMGDEQGNCNGVRTAAALAEVNWLATDPTGSGDPDFVVMGDLNAYAMEDPIAQFLNAGYVDEQRNKDGFESYTYVFGGEWGALDYALTSPNLHPQVTGFTAWHINADEPRALDYNEEFKSAGQIVTLYDMAPYRASDHDAVLIGLDLVRLPALTIDKSVELPQTIIRPGDVVTYTVTITNSGQISAAGTSVVDILPATLIGSGLNTTVDIPVGMSHTFVYTAEIAASALGLTVTNTANAYWGQQITVTDTASLLVDDVPTSISLSEFGAGGSATGLWVLPAALIAGVAALAWRRRQKRLL